MRDIWERRLIETIQSSCLEIHFLQFLVGFICGVRDQENMEQ